MSYFFQNKVFLTNFLIRPMMKYFWLVWILMTGPNVFGMLLALFSLKLVKPLLSFWLISRFCPSGFSQRSYYLMLRSFFRFRFGLLLSLIDAVLLFCWASYHLSLDGRIILILTDHRHKLDFAEVAIFKAQSGIYSRLT